MCSGKVVDIVHYIVYDSAGRNPRKNNIHQRQEVYKTLLIIKYWIYADYFYRFLDWMWLSQLDNAKIHLVIVDLKTMRVIAFCGSLGYLQNVQNYSLCNVQCLSFGIIGNSIFYMNYKIYKEKDSISDCDNYWNLKCVAIVQF